MPPDESTADDGAVHLLWRFLTWAALLRDQPHFDLDTPDGLAAANVEALARRGEFTP